MGFSRQEHWSGVPSPSPAGHRAGNKAQSLRSSTFHGKKELDWWVRKILQATEGVTKTRWCQTHDQMFLEGAEKCPVVGCVGVSLGNLLRPLDSCLGPTHSSLISKGQSLTVVGQSLENGREFPELPRNQSLRTTRGSLSPGRARTPWPRTRDPCCFPLVCSPDSAGKCALRVSPRPPCSPSPATRLAQAAEAVRRRSRTFPGTASSGSADRTAPSGLPIHADGMRSRLPTQQAACRSQHEGRRQSGPPGPRCTGFPRPQPPVHAEESRAPPLLTAAPVSQRGPGPRPAAGR